MKSRLYLLFVILSILISGCEKTPPANRSEVNAFYYWQTSLNNFSWHDSVYQALHVKKIYLRLFDIDWNKDARAAVPVSPLDVSWSFRRDTTVEMVPVVFITNETFKSLTRDQSVDLARLTHRKIMSFLSIYVSDILDVYDDRWGWQQDPYIIKSVHFDEHRQYDSLVKKGMAEIREIQFDSQYKR